MELQETVSFIGHLCDTFREVFDFHFEFSDLLLLDAQIRLHVDVVLFGRLHIRLQFPNYFILGRLIIAVTKLQTFAKYSIL